MEPETYSGVPEGKPTDNAAHVAPATADTTTADGAAALIPGETLAPKPEERKGVRWILMGSLGLRAGWSVLVFLLLTVLFLFPLGYFGSWIAKNVLHLQKGSFTPTAGIFQELVVLLAVLGAGALVALIERRRLLDYNLTGPHGSRNFIGGLVVGFVGLSVLVGALAMGGWLHFGPVALTGVQIFSNAALWGLCFVLVGFFEEGTFRCYLQFTLTRGINFWWALGIEGAICLELILRSKGNGVWGVYGVALLGLIPCLLLELRKVEGVWLLAGCLGDIDGVRLYPYRQQRRKLDWDLCRSSHWLCVLREHLGDRFGVVGHRLPCGLGLGGDVFLRHCRQRHAGSGPLPDCKPGGQVLWSGGTDGPEGSLLVLGAILLILVALLLIYGRKRETVQTVPAVDYLKA